MKVLIAEDDKTSRNILEVVLTRLGYEVVAVTDGERAWQTLQESDAPKLVILDWVMPKMEGVEICKRLRQNTEHDKAYTYIILLTAKGSKENIIKGMEAGADDYIVKPYDHNELHVRLRAGQRIVELQSELLRIKKELYLQSTTDHLTGILNRRALMLLIDKEYAQSMRSGKPFALSLLDIDHFKSVNDNYGHAAGDAVIREITKRIEGVIRVYDSLGRYGGEEFLILFPGAGDKEVHAISERIRTTISNTPVCIDRLEIPIAASQGIVTWNGELSVDEMIGAADEALYKAKAAGRNCVKTAPEVNAHISPSLISRIIGLG